MRTLLSFKTQHNSVRFVDTELKAKSVVQIDEEELEDFIHAVDTLMVGSLLGLNWNARLTSNPGVLSVIKQKRMERMRSYSTRLCVCCLPTRLA